MSHVTRTRTLYSMFFVCVHCTSPPISPPSVNKPLLFLTHALLRVSALLTDKPYRSTSEIETKSRHANGIVYLSYRVSNVLFVQFCAIGYIGTRCLYASTWTLRVKVMAVRVLAVGVAILSSYYLDVCLS